MSSEQWAGKTQACSESATAHCPLPTLRYGMIGGGTGAFIGEVHRMAARLDGGMELVTGALSSTPERAAASGKALGLADDRIYGTWREMLDVESKRSPGERIDFVSIVTPNDTHFAIAKAFVEAGFHVICDKPMVTTSEEADELVRLVEKAGTVFCVLYTYAGYPLVKQAREMVRDGELGIIRKVFVEYHQGWLAGKVEDTGNKQASWRTDPRRAGPAGALGDIGSHAEFLLSYVTGLEIDAICADLTSFVQGRQLDDDAAILLRFNGGAKGVLTASQVCIGAENGLSIRIYGTKGGLSWRQEAPNELSFFPAEGPERIYRRGNAYLHEGAVAAARLPPGHPEGFIEAFANVYKKAGRAMRAEATKRRSDEATKGQDSRPASRLQTPDSGLHDYPDVHDGARGVRFVEWALRAAAGTWTEQ